MGTNLAKPMVIVKVWIGRDQILQVRTEKKNIYDEYRSTVTCFSRLRILLFNKPVFANCSQSGNSPATRYHSLTHSLTSPARTRQADSNIMRALYCEIKLSLARIDRTQLNSVIADSGSVIITTPPRRYTIPRFVTPNTKSIDKRGRYFAQDSAE